MHFLNYLRNDRRYPEIRLSQCFYWFLQVPEAGVEQTGFEQGFKALSEISGPTSGPIGHDSETVDSLRQTALQQLAAASKTLKRLQDMPASQAERKALADACGLLQRGTSCLLNGFK